MNKFREIMYRMFQGRYGIDDLGKTLMIVSMALYLVGNVISSSVILSLSMVGMVFFIYRVMSKKHWDRSEENRKYNRYIKLWKLRYKERKFSRIFMCKSCGRMIRVPKGKGKIQVTCTVCGNKSIHRT